MYKPRSSRHIGNELRVAVDSQREVLIVGVSAWMVDREAVSAICGNVRVDNPINCLLR
jgi:hypothetical protein